MLTNFLTLLLVVLSLQDVCSKSRSRRGIPFTPKCPRTWNHPKCTCETSELTAATTIQCKGIIDPSEIKSAFTQNWDLGSQYLEWFTLADSTLSSLSDDVFGSVSFMGFIITNSTIASISDSAFKGSVSSARYIWASNSDFSYFNFQSLQVLKHLTSVSLTSCHITDVPNNAFGNLELLETIDLRDNAIDHLGQGAFASLPQLRRLDLSGNKINEITNGQLKFNMLTKPVVIVLSNNNIQSIEDNAFTNMNQPPSDLSLDGNKLQTLKEGVFAPLLRKMTSLSWGRFNVKGNPLVCNASLDWLLRKSKSTKYRNVVTGLQCPDGRRPFEKSTK